MEFKKKISLLSLVFVNLFAILGVIFLGWSWQAMLIVYWFESGIIGFYTLLKMGLASPKMPSAEKRAITSNINPLHAEKVFCLFFFLIHYGGFMSGHLIFIITFILTGINSTFAGGFNMFVSVVPLFFLLLISHGLSFYYNYYKNGQYTKTAPIIEMFKPYKRIIIMHLTILIVVIALASFSVESRVGVIAPAIILILVKTIFDAAFHIRESMDEPVLSTLLSVFKKN